MDSEDDKKHLYEVSEMQDQFSDSTGFDKTFKYSIPPAQSKDYPWKIFNIIFMAAVLLLLILILILAGVIAYDVRIDPQECTATTTTSAPSTGTGTGAVSAEPTNYTLTCNCEDDKVIEQQLMAKLEQVLSGMDYLRLYNEQQASATENDTASIAETLDVVKNTGDTLNSVVTTLSNIKDINIETDAVANDIRFLTEQLLELQNNTYYTEPTSCEDLKSRQPDSTDGYYHINSQIVYCKFGEMCGVNGSWARVAYFDMQDSTTNCPSGFRYYVSGGVRSCGRNTRYTASCRSMDMPTHGMSYSQVCGRVTGIQYASQDAFNTGINNIESYYVDGISITQGHPRKHVWTFAGGLLDSANSGANCPCNNPPGGNSGQLDSFVGDNYFCEAGAKTSWGRYVYYRDDPLWDGKGCGSRESACCAKEGLPWFYRSDLGDSTEPLELRVCGNQGWDDEDTPVQFFEVYVK